LQCIILYQISSFEQYQTEYKRSIDDPAEFWSSVAESFTWRKKWHTTLNWNFTDPKFEMV
jgi:acetyl-CoA synthetase